jgi:hypothetical protein
VSGFYQHPDPMVREDQERARARALRTVSTGSVRWNHKVGLNGGFVVRDRLGIDRRLGLTDAIAMHELLAAGVITRIQQGRVVLAEQKVSA